MAQAPPVARFAASAIAPVPRDEAEIQAERVAVLSARQSLFGVERFSAGALEARAHRLQADLKFKDYKRLSLEPLTWTGGTWSKWPMFAVYSLNNPLMVIRSDKAVRDNSGTWLPEVELPGPIVRIYAEHQQRLTSGRITSTFQGVIPKSVREDIEKAKPLFTVAGDSYTPVHTDIFLIGQAQWVEGNEPEPPRVRHWDPLVVGWDGLDLWLISQFDLTTVERYMIEEFPALPEHTNLMVLPPK